MDITASKVAYLTIPEVAAQMRCGQWHVKKLIGSGDLRATKPAGKWLIAPADLSAYVDSRSNRPRLRRRSA